MGWVEVNTSVCDEWKHVDSTYQARAEKCTYKKESKGYFFRFYFCFWVKKGVVPFVPQKVHLEKYMANSLCFQKNMRFVYD